MRRTTWSVVICSMVSLGGGAAAQVGPPKAYTVSPTLKEVANARQFKGTPAQRALLAKNLFVVSPTTQQQLFFIYENNDYGNLPTFVTSDLVLQLFHVFYGFTLRRIETSQLLPLARRLASAMLKQSVDTWRTVEGAEWKAAALKNVAYFAVAARLLQPKTVIPPEAAALAQRELALIDKHGGLDLGAVFPYKLDYSQFVPRGHYSRTEELKRYFKGMLWFGLTPFCFRKQVMAGSEVRTVVSEDTVRMGLLLARDLTAAKMVDTWERIYEPTAFLVGVADDLTPAEYKRLSDEVYGKDAPLAAFADKGKLRQLIDRGVKLRRPRIQPKVRHVFGALLPFPDPATPQLRLMGQRHIPDSEVTQRLTHPGDATGKPRYFPTGLDVMAVLGSARARQLLDVDYPDLYQTKVWRGYAPERARLASDFAKVSDKEWTRNVYWGWLWALQALLRPATTTSPSFMRGAAWQDKSLNTALASWAELRHDTILYGKQSFTGAECGGDDEPANKPRHTVEPNVELYRRLLTITRLARDGLVRRKLVNAALKDKFDRFTDLLLFLQRIAEKQLRGQAPTEKENDQLRIIGSTVEYLSLAVMQDRATRWSEITSPTDRNMAVVADVHTGGEAPEMKVLEEGVGLANEIFVIVPVGKRLQIARGATFSYYEFLQPMKNRLTDEAWQKLIKEGKAPPLPPWMKSFLAAPPASGKETMKATQYRSGC
jgi:hypothetical protein